ncbi:MAG: rhomboid family intramembrane serine protease [Pseudomonadota bacterium]|nr:rhomboid family intramembrane serine protease [Pseudomonadota bacterium]
MSPADPPSTPPGAPAPDPATALAWREAERRFVARVARPPRATVALLAVLVALHVATGVASAPGTGVWQQIFGSRSRETMVEFGARDGSLVAAGEVWRLVSHGFLHWDLSHLFMNGLALWGLGRLCETVFGPVRFYWIFLVSVLGGGLFSQTAGAQVVSAGASGGVFGLLGALVAFGVSRRRRLSPRLSAVFIEQLWPWILVNLGIGLLLPFIDNRAHVGGLLAGAACALVLRDQVTSDRPPPRGVTAAMIGTMALVLTWAAAMVALHAG